MNKEDREKLREHIERVQFKIVDAAAHIVDAVAANMKQSAEGRQAQATVARRQVANLLRVSQFCANKACRRSHCCRGEPLHCLQSAMPLMPPDAFGDLVKKKRPGARASLHRHARA